MLWYWVKSFSFVILTVQGLRLDFAVSHRRLFTVADISSRAFCPGIKLSLRAFYFGWNRLHFTYPNGCSLLTAEQTLLGLTTAFSFHPSELALCSPRGAHSPAPGLCHWHLWALKSFTKARQTASHWVNVITFCSLFLDNCLTHLKHTWPPPPLACRMHKPSLLKLLFLLLTLQTVLLPVEKYVLFSYMPGYYQYTGCFGAFLLLLSYF